MKDKKSSAPASSNSPLAPSERAATTERRTGETSIQCAVLLEGAGEAEVSTGIGFFDHMLAALAKHARINLTLQCAGDLEIDDHHTVEDCALAIGSAINDALGDRNGIARFGHAYVPLDEALARAVIDLSGRAWCEADLRLVRERVGELSCENVSHFFQSLARTMRASIHVDILRGANDHHKIEAAFKAFALALRQSIAIDVNSAGHIPSTKGVL